MQRDLIRFLTKGDVARAQELWSKVPDIEDNLNILYSAAAISGNRDMVEFVWSQGVPVDFYDGEALVYVCNKMSQKPGEKRTRQLDMVRFLIYQGIPANIRGGEACICAARNGDLELLDILVSRGANPRVDEDHALTLAASNGHAEVVEYLLSKGADPNTDDSAPMKFAIDGGHISCAYVLHSHGADVSDKTLLDIAEDKNDMSMIKFLTERGCALELMQ